MVYRRALVSSFIEKDIEQYGVIKLTDEGQKFLDNPKSFMLMEDHNFDENEEEEKIQEKGGVSALDDAEGPAQEGRQAARAAAVRHFPGPVTGRYVYQLSDHTRRIGQHPGRRCRESTEIRQRIRRSHQTIR